MSAFTQLFVSLLAAAPCFEPTDATPGWKIVALPPEAPALAAVGEIEQFRGGEQAMVVEEVKSAYRLPSRDLPGVSRFDFELRKDSRTLTVVFTEALRGAKVDVLAQGNNGPMQLMREVRVAGPELTLSWQDNEVWLVSIRVHDHLRRQPIVQSWKNVRHVSPSQLAP
jgi:hypothetical protein